MAGGGVGGGPGSGLGWWNNPLTSSFRRGGATINGGTVAFGNPKKEVSQKATTPSAPALPDPGPGPAPTPPPAPQPKPSTPPPSLQFLGGGGGGEQAAGAAQFSGMSILDQDIGMRFPPSLAALLGKKAY